MEDKIFDKYVVKSKSELSLLQHHFGLSGAYMITGDTQHIRIHQHFYRGQRFKHWIGRGGSRKPEHADLSHNMICVGWNYEKDRPILAHMVKKHGWQFYNSSVKVNSACYFTYADNDVDFLYVYIPKDPVLKSEICQNAYQTASISADPQQSSSFSMGQLFTGQVKNPEDVSTEKMIERLAPELADLILNNPMLNDNGQKTRKFTCASYAMLTTQASELLAALGDQERQQWFDECAKCERGELINNISALLADQNSTIGAAFAKSDICKFDSFVACSSDIAYQLDRVSEHHAGFFTPTPSQANSQPEGEIRRSLVL